MTVTTCGNYRVKLCIPGEAPRYLGCFPFVEEAAQAYAEAYCEHHGGLPQAPVQPAHPGDRSEPARHQLNDDTIDLTPFRSAANSSG